MRLSFIALLMHASYSASPSCAFLSSAPPIIGRTGAVPLDPTNSKTKLFGSTQPKSQTQDVSNPFLVTDCDNSNIPPSLSKIITSILSIKSGSDIRGVYTDHRRMGSILNVSHALSSMQSARHLTPFAAYCYGAAFAQMVQIRSGKGTFASNFPSIARGVDEWGDEANIQIQSQSQTSICIGRDPRNSGIRLADAFCRGVESVDGVIAQYTGLASTPAMFEFCRSDMCDGAVMITASHLPEDRNGMKFFTKNGGLTKQDIEILAERATASAKEWFDFGIVPPSSGEGAVYCTSWVDNMPHYETFLRNAILRETSSSTSASESSNNANQVLPLAGLRIVLNAGNGSGYFFNKILQDLGADVSNSIHLEPNGTFPPKTGVPNPEYSAMIDETTKTCEACKADIGIMLDTDADRCGFVVPTRQGSGDVEYEALNRNRLIALLAVIFQTTSPGCTFVTDSVTSEGLALFLKNLGLNHVRYLKGYANVIGKARELTESGKALAEVAIETSGHCAMRENGYLDDGTYTAVKVIGLLARVSRSRSKNGESQMSLLDLISELDEMEEVHELRMEVSDGSLETTNTIFEKVVNLIEAGCTDEENGWELDTENLEGVRVRIGGGGFFMLRKSLHDPLISLQLEGSSVESLRDIVVGPILALFQMEDHKFSSDIDTSCLANY